MREYVTQAIILDREPQGEADARVTFWSRDFGKMRGRATSLRKITSKLSAHLEPGILSDLRIVENRNLQIVDALKVRRLAVPHSEIRHLMRLLADGEPDGSLWSAATAANWSWNAVLATMGWDPHYAECDQCTGTPWAFSPATHDFLCSSCASKAPYDALVYIHHAAI